MKKIATISFAAALISLACMSTSCEKNGAQGGIGFKATCASTKGVEITTETLKLAPYGKFYWDGFYPTSNSASYAHKLATWKSELNVYNTEEFWPDDVDQALDFWCYAPLSEWASTPTFSETHAKMAFSYTPANSASSAAVDQSDLLVAYGGQMTFNQAGHTDHRVPLTFLHPLCGIKFKIADLTALPDGDKVCIKSVSLNGVSLSGNCVATRTSNAECSFAWTPSATTGSYKQAFPWAADTYATEGMVLNTLIDNAFLMIVPQTLTSSNSITIDFSVKGIDQPAKTANLNTSGISLEAGKIYTFTLKIKPEAILVTITVDPWIEHSISL